MFWLAFPKYCAVGSLGSSGTTRAQSGPETSEVKYVLQSKSKSMSQAA